MTRSSVRPCRTQSRRGSTGGRSRLPGRSRSARRTQCARAGPGARRAARRRSRWPGPRRHRGSARTCGSSTASRHARSSSTPSPVARAERCDVGRERRDRFRRLELEVDVAGAEVVALDGQRRAGEPDARSGSAPGRRRAASAGAAAPSARRRCAARRARARRARRRPLSRAGSRSSTAARRGRTPLPSVGWPAKGSSTAGVKILMRTSASSLDGGRTNTVSDRFVSFASACIVSVVEVACIGEDGELVACERDVGEDVADDVAEAPHGATLAARFRVRPWREAAGRRDPHSSAGRSRGRSRRGHTGGAAGPAARRPRARGGTGAAWPRAAIRAATKPIRAASAIRRMISRTNPIPRWPWSPAGPTKTCPRFMYGCTHSP